jgi:hypothetical protein
MPSQKKTQEMAKQDDAKNDAHDGAGRLAVSFCVGVLMLTVCACVCAACLLELPSFIPEDFPGEISLLPKGGGGVRSILQRPVGHSLTNNLDDISKGRDFKKTLIGTAKSNCAVNVFCLCVCL